MTSSHTDTERLRKIADEVQKNFCVPYAQDIDDAADVIDRMRDALQEILQYDQNPQALAVARRGLGIDVKSDDLRVEENDRG